MSLVLTEDQESIRRTARKLVASLSPNAQLRSLRDADDPLGYSRELWGQMAELGLAGITLAERHGGAGLGLTELGLVLEECGRKLVPSPLFATLLLGGAAIQLGGSEEQRSAWLPPMARGEVTATLAHEEGSRHDRQSIFTLAEPEQGGYRLTGQKTMVVDGHIADVIVVVARVPGSGREGPALFLVRRGQPGVELRRRSTVDSRNFASIRLEGVHVGEEALLGSAGGDAELLDVLLDRAAIGLSAEMLGGMQEAFEQTVAYLKVREQFGVPIGSFQALKHRAADLFCEIELARSLVIAALRSADEGSHGGVESATLASAAKARVSEVFVQVANEAIQMHGGIGATDELDIGFFLKRARVTGMMLGAAPYHRDRFARLSGY